MRWLLGLCLFCAAINNVQSAQVTDLPGLTEKIGFNHYSGYLQASKTHFLHYWFVESQNEPSSDPLVVWMNGGKTRTGEVSCQNTCGQKWIISGERPGCSSLDGLLSELGPFHIRDNGRSVYLNKYSWNKRANVIFLEAPAGVGFSYSSDGNVTTSDDQTSRENYQALQQFFVQFPQYRQHDLYITGESYGGIYVPTLVGRIIDGMSTYHMNLKGMAVGNGMVSFPLNTDTLINFMYERGLVDEKLWNTVETACCRGCGDTCQFHDPAPGFCTKVVERIQQEAWSSGLNVYDLYRDCYKPVQNAVLHPRFRADMRGLLSNEAFKIFENFATSPSRNFVTEANVNESPPCINATAVTNYLNQDSVRAALHIPGNVPTWSVCSDPVGKVYQRQYNNMTSHFKKAILAKIKILIYNGDTDMACNFMMGQRFAKSLGLPLIASKQAWMYKGQNAGFVTTYRGLDFVTIKGTGHMVPQWKPGQAFEMINAFLDERAY